MWRGVAQGASGQVNQGGEKVPSEFSGSVTVMSLSHSWCFVFGTSALLCLRQIMLFA